MSKEVLSLDSKPFFQFHFVPYASEGSSETIKSMHKYAMSDCSIKRHFFTSGLAALLACEGVISAGSYLASGVGFFCTHLVYRLDFGRGFLDLNGDLFAACSSLMLAAFGVALIGGALFYPKACLWLSSDKADVGHSRLISPEKERELRALIAKPLLRKSAYAEEQRDAARLAAESQRARVAQVEGERDAAFRTTESLRRAISQIKSERDSSRREAQILDEAIKDYEALVASEIEKLKLQYSEDFQRLAEAHHGEVEQACETEVDGLLGNVITEQENLEEKYEKKIKKLTESHKLEIAELEQQFQGRPTAEEMTKLFEDKKSEYETKLEQLEKERSELEAKIEELTGERESNTRGIDSTDSLAAQLNVQSNGNLSLKMGSPNIFNHSLPAENTEMIEARHKKEIDALSEEISSLEEKINSLEERVKLLKQIPKDLRNPEGIQQIANLAKAIIEHLDGLPDADGLQEIFDIASVVLCFPEEYNSAEKIESLIKDYFILNEENKSLKDNASKNFSGVNLSPEQTEAIKEELLKLVKSNDPRDLLHHVERLNDENERLKKENNELQTAQDASSTASKTESLDFGFSEVKEEVTDLLGQIDDISGEISNDLRKCKQALEHILKDEVTSESEELAGLYFENVDACIKITKYLIGCHQRAANSPFAEKESPSLGSSLLDESCINPIISGENENKINTLKNILESEKQETLVQIEELYPVNDYECQELLTRLSEGIDEEQLGPRIRYEFTRLLSKMHLIHKGMEEPISSIDEHNILSLKDYLLKITDLLRNPLSTLSQVKISGKIWLSKGRPTEFKIIFSSPDNLAKEILRLHRYLDENFSEQWKRGCETTIAQFSHLKTDEKFQKLVRALRSGDIADWSKWNSEREDVKSKVIGLLDAAVEPKDILAQLIDTSFGEVSEIKTPEEVKIEGPRGCLQMLYNLYAEQDHPSKEQKYRVILDEVRGKYGVNWDTHKAFAQAHDGTSPFYNGLNRLFQTLDEPILVNAGRAVYEGARGQYEAFVKTLNDVASSELYLDIAEFYASSRKIDQLESQKEQTQDVNNRGSLEREIDSLQTKNRDLRLSITDDDTAAFRIINRMVVCRWEEVDILSHEEEIVKLMIESYNANCPSPVNREDLTLKNLSEEIRKANEAIEKAPSEVKKPLLASMWQKLQGTLGLNSISSGPNTPFRREQVEFKNEEDEIKSLNILRHGRPTTAGSWNIGIEANYEAFLIAKANERKAIFNINLQNRTRNGYSIQATLDVEPESVKAEENLEAGHENFFHMVQSFHPEVFKKEYSTIGELHSTLLDHFGFTEALASEVRLCCLPKALRESSNGVEEYRSRFDELFQLVYDRFFKKVEGADSFQEIPFDHEQKEAQQFILLFYVLQGLDMQFLLEKLTGWEIESTSSHCKDYLDRAGSLALVRDLLFILLSDQEADKMVLNSIYNALLAPPILVKKQGIIEDRLDPACRVAERLYERYFSENKRVDDIIFNGYRPHALKFLYEPNQEACPTPQTAKTVKELKSFFTYLKLVGETNEWTNFNVAPRDLDEAERDDEFYDYLADAKVLINKEEFTLEDKFYQPILDQYDFIKDYQNNGNANATPEICEKMRALLEDVKKYADELTSLGIVSDKISGVKYELNRTIDDWKVLSTASSRQIGQTTDEIIGYLEILELPSDVVIEKIKKCFAANDNNLEQVLGYLSADSQNQLVNKLSQELENQALNYSLFSHHEKRYEIHLTLDKNEPVEIKIKNTLSYCLMDKKGKFIFKCEVPEELAQIELITSIFYDPNNGDKKYCYNWRVTEIAPEDWKAQAQSAANERNGWFW